MVAFPRLTTSCCCCRHPPPFPRARTGMATSQDGFAWKKKGPVFDGGPEGSFDDAGVSRRRVVMLKG